MPARHGHVVTLLITFMVLFPFGCGKDETTNPVNTAPTASFTMTPSSGTTATVFQFDASGSSDAQDPVAALEVRWDWENDGTWDVTWTITKTASHQFGSVGTKTVKLEVKDTAGLADDTTGVVAIGNTPPTASFAVTPASGTTNTQFHFDASGCSDPENSAALLQVRWDWENDGTWDTGWSTTKIADYQYGAAGMKTIKLSVMDTGALTDDTTGAVTVGEFELPEMVLVAAGTFEMGDGEAWGCGTDQHDVSLTHAFYMGRYEVTNKEYCDALQWAFAHGYVTATSEAVIDQIDGSGVTLVDLAAIYCQITFGGGVFTVDEGKDDYPMVEANWYGAAAYCDWLSLQTGIARAYNHLTWQCNLGDPYTAGGYRLPTDAEWEYATQCGGERIYPWGNQSPDCGRANYWNQGRGCVGATVRVGSYPAAPPSLGLYDMAGNVWEWCNDWHTCHLGYESVSDPPGPSSGLYRVVRGGSWYSGSDILRCACRLTVSPSTTGDGPGFRIARTQWQ